MVAAVCAVTVVLSVGCEEREDDELDADLAKQLAALEAEEVAFQTVELTRHRALFHPDSHRQRSAREQLLFLQEHRDQLGDGDSADGEPLDDIELQEWP